MASPRWAFPYHWAGELTLVRDILRKNSLASVIYCQNDETKFKNAYTQDASVPERVEAKAQLFAELE